MPIDPDLYPSDWPAIARHVKEEANWHCEQCGHRCYQPSESLPRHIKNWRRVLAVAHLDRHPANNECSNLKALCVVCHLDYDRVEHMHKSKRTWTLKKAGPTSPMPLWH